MEIREFICIRCPMGCPLRAEVANGTVSRVSGNGCRRGADYAAQEAVAPKRTVTSSVRVTGGKVRLAAVKTVPEVPRESIFAVMDAIRALRVATPVHMGQVLCRNIAGTGCDLIATVSVD
ncbi:MAG: DUF1667 domain-containing protein [Oscillospiraceae bacterium]|nr:DUF1667 domain-containing protein [Oscillospiraceae bacterium]